MSEALEDTDVVDEAADDKTADQTDQTASAEDHAEIEADASRMGWKPKAEHKGSAPWVDAAEYVRRGREVLPILQSQNSKLDRALRKAQDEIADLKASFAEFGKHHTDTVKRQYAAARRDLEAELAEHAEAGDVEAVKATTQKISDLSVEMEAGPKTDPKANGAADAERINREYAAKVETFKDENPWYGTDEVMSDWANSRDARLAAQGMDPDTRFRDIAREAKKAFPDRFKNPRREEASSVEGAPASRSNGAGKSYSDLPREAKEACDRFVKAKLVTREQYTKDYFA